MPLPFDTDAENTKLAEIREREEEELAQILAQKYGVEYVDLGGVAIDNDALRLVPEAVARSAGAAATASRRLSAAIRSSRSPPRARPAPSIFRAKN